MKKRIHNIILTNIKNAEDVVAATSNLVQYQIAHNAFNDNEVINEINQITSFYNNHLKDQD